MPNPNPNPNPNPDPNPNPNPTQVRTEPTFALAQEMLADALGARGRLAEAESALNPYP